MREWGPGPLAVPPALESPRSVLATGSFGYKVVKWAKRRLKLTLDPWQVYALDRMLEHDSDMQLLARTVLLSVARQNGKSVIVRSFVGWLLDEGHKWDTFRKWDFILLAAHDAKQARIPYDYIRRDVMSYSDINTWSHSARRQGVARARATQYTGIELNGVRVDVATSQPGSARGISPGLVCFDEVLTQTSFETYEGLLIVWCYEQCTTGCIVSTQGQSSMTHRSLGYGGEPMMTMLHQSSGTKSLKPIQHSQVADCRGR